MARCWSGAHGQGDRTCGVGTSHPELVGMRWGGGGAAQGPGSFTPSSPPHPLCPSLPSVTSGVLSPRTLSLWAGPGGTPKSCGLFSPVLGGKWGRTGSVCCFHVKL